MIFATTIVAKVIIIMIEVDMNDMLTIIIVKMTTKITTLMVWRHLLQ